jgi:acetyl-CoA carboxylase carboxyl transferase subunit alpha
MQHLSAYEKVQLARHPQRPYFLDYVQHLCSDFMEVHGDRKFGDDRAIVGGFAFFRGRAVCLVGIQKGRDTKQKLYRNFGMPKPEGYRKALRIMKVAENSAGQFLLLSIPLAHIPASTRRKGDRRRRSRSICGKCHRSAFRSS